MGKTSSLWEISIVKHKISRYIITNMSITQLTKGINLAIIQAIKINMESI